MKKIALIISMVALVSLQGFAQRGTYSFGIKFGPTFDWASPGSKVSKNEGLRMGFTIGGIVDHYITNHVAISSGLNFNFWRGHYSFTDLRMPPDFLEEAIIEDVDRQVRACYFEVPVKVKVKAPIVDGLKAFAEAGVGFSLNTKDLTKDAYEFCWVSYNDSFYSNSHFYQYRWFQVALNFGIGVEYEINSKLGVFVQITSNNALTNTFTKEIEKLTGSNLKTNFIGIELGIML